MYLVAIREERVVQILEGAVYLVAIKGERDIRNT